MVIADLLEFIEDAVKVFGIYVFRGNFPLLFSETVKWKADIFVGMSVAG